MRAFFLLVSCFLTTLAISQQLFQMPSSVQTRIVTFENPSGAKGAGGKENKGAKGHAFDFIQPGKTVTLLNAEGEGTVQRIWMTLDQPPATLRAVRLRMYWDGAAKPAVDVPLSDFFGYNSGVRVAFQSEFFSSGEGRSYNCYIPMPFRRGAIITLTNEDTVAAKLYYEVDYQQAKVPPASLYFHAYFTRQITSVPGTDYEPLPKVSGRGRYLGMSVGLQLNSSYRSSWWGEGEIRMFLDGDTPYPSVANTGLEDYIGSGYGLGLFTNRYQGCTVANDSTGQYSFYRFHVPDAIWFHSGIRIIMQQIGGWGRDSVNSLIRRGVPLIPVSDDAPSGFTRFLEMKHPPKAMDSTVADGWVNFYRADDYSSVCYFYLDKPVSGLPGLAAVGERMKKSAQAGRLDERKE